MVNQTFEDYLKDWFVKQNEFGGIPITKDNCENLFERYVESVETERWMELATLFGQMQFIEGETTQIKKQLERLTNK
jgi:hypothetical protein